MTALSPRAELAHVLVSQNHVETGADGVFHKRPNMILRESISPVSMYRLLKNASGIRSRC